MKILLTNKWFFISLIEFVVIILLVYKNRKKKDLEFADQEIKRSKDADIDMDNVLRSINLAPELYKKLCRVCHPDRFAGKPQEEIANRLFQELQLVQNNYAELTNLKIQIEGELGVKIK